MINKDFYAALEEICVSKGIEKQVFLDTLQNALTSAYKKHAKDACDVVIKYNEEKCAIKFYAVKKIVEECFPEEYAAVVTGGREENKTLLENKFDMVFFTGSQNVGREVLKKMCRTPYTSSA